MSRSFYLIFIILLVSKESISQKNKKEDGHSIKILTKICRNEYQLKDTNANKLYYLQYVFPPNNSVNKADTIWAEAVGSDTNEIKKWTFVSTIHDVLWYISKTPVSIKNGLITFWVRDWRYFEKITKVDYQMILSVMNCQEKTLKIIRTIDFDFSNNILADNNSYNDFKFPIPNSLGEKILNRALYLWVHQ